MLRYYSTKQILVLFICLISITSTLKAQQQAQFSQYMDNMLYYNPAYAGSHDMMNISALHRQQWLGFKGAPMSTTFGLHTPLNYDNIGLGISFLNDRVGPTNSTWVNADISYSLDFSRDRGNLAFGIKAGANFLNGNVAKLMKEDVADATLDVQYQEVNVNVGAGIYYHSKHWFAGFAVPKILGNVKGVDILQSEYIAKRHYYFMAGGYFKINRMIKLRPSTMLKITDNAPMSLDLTLATIIYDKWWFGANYRLLESVGVFAQFQISNKFKIGYAFEFSTSMIRENNAGTHELMLSYDLLLRNNRYIGSPRFF